MPYSHVIVVDQGTHSTRAIIYDRNGNLVLESRQSIDLNLIDNFHVEQDGTQILRSCKNVLAKASNYLGSNEIHDFVAAIVTQRSTTIAWDLDTGRAISPALSWLDTRAEKYLSEIELSNHAIKQKTGLPLTPHYGASKLKWLIENDVNVQIAHKQERLAIGPLASYLIANLIKGSPYCIDYSNAHRTLLWNIETKEWDEEILNEFSILQSQLPTVVPNLYQFGELKGVNCQLVYVNGDQNSAVYGYGNVEDDSAFVNIGTGGFVLMKSANPILNTSLLASITYSSNGLHEYSIEGTVNGAGTALSWAEDVWKLSDIERIQWCDVEDIPIFINTIGGLGSPWWTNDISPMFIGDKSYRDYSPGQCKAALMESIIFLIFKNLEIMLKQCAKVKKIIISGGMSEDKYFCQRLADLSALPVISTKIKETTSRGAAWLVFGRPNWCMPETFKYNPCKDEALNFRYTKFISEIERQLH